MFNWIKGKSHSKKNIDITLDIAPPALTVEEKEKMFDVAVNNVYKDHLFDAVREELIKSVIGEDCYAQTKEAKRLRANRVDYEDIRLQLPLARVRYESLINNVAFSTEITIQELINDIVEDIIKKENPNENT